MNDKPTDEGNEMFGRDKKVSIPQGRHLADGRVSFKSGAKPGPSGSGERRNARVAAKSTTKPKN